MIIYILSDISNAKQFEWIVKSDFNKKKSKIKFILINKSNLKNNLEKFLTNHDSIIATIKYKNFSSYFIVFFKLIYFLLKYKPRIIHCHLRKASIFGIIIGYILGIKKRILTRHHGDENHNNFIKGLLIDKLVCKLATKIISISANTSKLLINENNSNKYKINLIYHGFDFDYFNNIDPEKINYIKKKYKINSNAFVIGSISRFIDWKGINFTIRAFREFNKINPNSILVLANANGPYEKEIYECLNDLPKNSYRLIHFEPDVRPLYKIFDIFVHVPINSKCEAFGQVYIESLALKVPSIFTKSGIGSEFLEHKKNCYIAEYKDYYSIYNGLIFYQNNELIKSNIVQEAYSNVINKFSINNMLNKLDLVYFDEK